MQYRVTPAEEGNGFLVQSMTDGRPVTRVGVRPKLSAAQRLAEQTAGRRLTWVKEMSGAYVSQQYNRG